MNNDNTSKIDDSFDIVMFSNIDEFSDYIQSKRPKEVWLDIFSEKEPYIIISSYRERENKLSGCYNHQKLLASDIDDCCWLFEDGMYVKHYHNTPK